MTWIKGFAFRATAGFVTDAANDTYVVADAYPTTRNGVTFGYVGSMTGISFIDNSTTVDPRLAGKNEVGNAAFIFPDFRIDLEGADQYDIRLANGSLTYGQFEQYVQIRDGTTTPVLTLNNAARPQTAGDFFDAANVKLNQTTWPGSNAAVRVTFTGAVAHLRYGFPDATHTESTCMAYLQLTRVVAAGADHLAMQTQPSSPITSGSTHATQPVVAIKNSSNATVTTDTSTVTAVLVVETGSATALGTLTKVAVSGVSAFIDLGASSAAGATAHWHFTDGALTAVDSATFTISPSTSAHHLAISTQPSTPIASGAAHVTQPAGTIRDISNVVVTGDTSTVTAALVIESGAATPLGTLTKAAVAGNWDFAGNGLGATSAAGAIAHWHFTDGALLAVDSNSFTITPTPAAPTGQLLQYLTFFVDDTHTIDGAVVPGIPTVAQTSCSTDPLHSRPWMMLIEEGVDSSVDLIEASVAIGSLLLRVQDTRRLASQDTGWFTFLLSDAGGKSALIGQRVSFKQIDQFGSEYNIDLLVQDIELENPSKTVYKIATRDIRERERTMGLFYRAEESVIWPYNSVQLNGILGGGIRDGYGQLAPGSALSPQLVPPARGAKANWQFNGKDPNVPAGTFVFYEQPYVDAGNGRDLVGKSDWDVMFAQYNVTSGGSYDTSVAPTAQTSRLTTSQLTGMTVQWRPWGSTGAWTTLRNSPLWEINQAANNMWAFQYGFYYIKSKSGPGTLIQNELFGAFISQPTFATLPTAGQDVEVRFLSGLPPTEKDPIYFEGTFGAFLKKCYDGDYSVQPAGIRYNATVMTDLVANTPICRLIKTNTEKEGLRWLQENWYKVMRMIPLINDAGEIVPTSYELPDAGVVLTTLDNSNVANASWKHGSGDAVTSVEFTYHRDYITKDRRFGSIQVVADRINAEGAVRVGDKPVKFSPETVRDLTNSPHQGYGQAPGTDLGYYLSRRIGTSLVNRFALGGQHLDVQALRSDPAVRVLKEGMWCQVSLTWLPEYGSKLRGMNRLMQVIKAQDTSPIVRRFELVDAGPYATVMAAPIVTDISVTLGDGTLSVATANTPASGGYARVDIATNATQPGATAPQWQTLGRKLGPGTVTVQSRKLPPGTTFVRVRFEREGQRPSGWTVKGSVTVTTQLLSSMVQIVDKDGYVTLTWNPDALIGGLRLYYASFAPEVATSNPTAFLDIDASTGTYTFAAPLKQYYRSVIDAIAYPGFSGGVVTGTPGQTQRLVEAQRYDLDTVMPAMAPVGSENGAIAILTLTLTDPQGRVSLVEASVWNAQNMISDWAAVSSVGSIYTIAALLVEKQTTIIKWRLTARVSATLKTIVDGDSMPFAIGAVPVPPVFSHDFDANGVVSFLMKGDSDTTEHRIFVQLDTQPSNAQVDATAAIVGRIGNAIGPTLTPGQKFYAAARAYNTALPAGPGAMLGTVTATAGVTNFSQSQAGIFKVGFIFVRGGIKYTILTFDGTLNATVTPADTFAASAFTGHISNQGSAPSFLTEQYAGNSLGRATINVDSIEVGPSSVTLKNLTFGPQTQYVDIWVLESKTDPGGASDMTGIGYRYTHNRSYGGNIVIPVSMPLNYVRVSVIAWDALNRVGINPVSLDATSAYVKPTNAPGIMNLKLRAAASGVVAPLPPASMSAAVSGSTAVVSVVMPSSITGVDFIRVLRNGTPIGDVARTAGASATQVINDPGRDSGSTYTYTAYTVTSGGPQSDTYAAAAPLTFPMLTIPTPSITTLRGWRADVGGGGFEVVITPGAGAPAGVTYYVQHKYHNAANVQTGYFDIGEGPQTSPTFTHIHSPEHCTFPQGIGNHQFRVYAQKAGWIDSAWSADSPSDFMPCNYP